jgi:hypothetical protein
MWLMYAVVTPPFGRLGRAPAERGNPGTLDWQDTAELSPPAAKPAARDRRRFGLPYEPT